MPYFTARLAASSESQPDGKRVYETMAQWAYLAGPKAVAEGG